MRSLLFFVIFLATRPVLSGEVEDALDASPPQWLRQHFEDNQAALGELGNKASGAVGFVFGNDIWRAGNAFANGNSWLALVCGEESCSFEPASLQAIDEEWQDHYDENVKTAGQRLTFKLDGVSRGKVIAWFDTAGAPKWLSFGALSSYYTGEGANSGSGDGTLEINIDLPGGGTTKLVPMLLKVEQAAMPSNHAPEHQDSFLLQLRAEGKRQLLTGELAKCSHRVDRGYLLWAGDMDKDGKADYLVNYHEPDGVRLYLSGLRKAGQLVGLAGVDSSGDGECDEPGC